MANTQIPVWCVKDSATMTICRTNNIRAEKWWNKRAKWPHGWFDWGKEIWNSGKQHSECWIKAQTLLQGHFLSTNCRLYDTISCHNDQWDASRKGGKRLELATITPYLKLIGLMWKPHISLVGGNVANLEANNENSSESQADTTLFSLIKWLMRMRMLHCSLRIEMSQVMAAYERETN